MAKFYYGGQAVLEGVMMRGRTHMAVAVRAPDGKIVVHEETLVNGIYSPRIANIPLVRGVALLWDSLALGSKALRFSAAVAEEGDENAPPQTHALGNEVVAASPKHTEGIDKGAKAAMATSLLIAVAIFFAGPLLLVGWLDQFIHDDWASNVIEGAIRLAMLLGYMWAIGRVPEIARVFGYHGAEHKTINAYEAGTPLTPSEVKKFTLIHPRCGTTFLLVVVVISIIMFVLLGRPPFWIRLASRIVLVPLVASVAYEAIRWAAGHYGNRVVRAVMAPGLALQRMTTREPDESMIEVGIVALKHVLAADGVAVPAENKATQSETELRTIERVVPAV